MNCSRSKIALIAVVGQLLVVKADAFLQQRELLLGLFELVLGVAAVSLEVLDFGELRAVLFGKSAILNLQGIELALRSKASAQRENHEA